MSQQIVNLENFRRAESDAAFAAIVVQANGTGRWSHGLIPQPVDNQPIVRMNRDTLYSAAIVDISQGATLSIPHTGRRYISVMIVNQDHYINRVFHDPGEYELTQQEFDTEFVMVTARILVDASDPEDVKTVNELQLQLGITQKSPREFIRPAVDEESLLATRQELLTRGRQLQKLDRCFGRKQDVDPERHLIGTAMAWGGLPETEAIYLNVDPGLPVAHHALKVADVPVDGFWSISVYNADGYFEANSAGLYSLNSITAQPNADGTITVNFGGDPEAVNYLPITQGWNYLVRLYRPRAEIFDGSWQFPRIHA